MVCPSTVGSLTKTFNHQKYMYITPVYYSTSVLSQQLDSVLSLALYYRITHPRSNTRGCRAMIRAKRKRASPFRVGRRRRDRLLRHFVVACIRAIVLLLAPGGGVVAAFSSSSEPPPPSPSANGIRLNKVFTLTHSRRQADALIAAGRVRVNGAVPETMGVRVRPYRDAVELDGVMVRGWETARPELQPWAAAEEEFIKFWKPVGVTCTTDRAVPGNLLDALEQGHLTAGNNKAAESKSASFPSVDWTRTRPDCSCSRRTVGSPTRCCGKNLSAPKPTE